MLQVNLFMIYIIHKISISITDSIFNHFFKGYNIPFSLKKKKLILFTACDENFKAWKDNYKKEDNIFKNVKNLFRLKKEIVTPQLKIK